MKDDVDNQITRMCCQSHLACITSSTQDRHRDGLVDFGYESSEDDDIDNSNINMCERWGLTRLIQGKLENLKA